jgi:hypothetical protein
MNTSDLAKAASLIYPIMLAQEAGEISEQKSAELLGIGLMKYRETKAQAINTILSMVKSLPSPLILLVDGMKGLQQSSTPPTNA